MNAETNSSSVETALAAATTMQTVNELRRTTGLDEPTVRAQLKALAQQGQIEHIPGRGRYDGRYGLLRPIDKPAPAGGDSEGGEADVSCAPERHLTEAAQAERDEFISEYGRGGNCFCYISPPCSSCTHPGNPRNQDEYESCWTVAGVGIESGDADGSLINEGTTGTESADDGTAIAPGDDLTTRAVKLAVRNHNARGEQGQEYMGLQAVIADIRAAIGDKTGKIMLGELAAHIATLYRLGEAHREACMTWERSMMEAIGEDGTGSVATAIEKLKADLANAKALADKLEHLLGSERTACAALREQLDGTVSPTLESITPSGYLVRAPKRAHRIVTKQDRAQAHAMAAAANGSGRGEVFALIPIGVAKRGASWIPVK